MKLEDLKQGISVDGPVFGQPVQIVNAVQTGKTTTVIYRGLRDSQLGERTLTVEQAALCKPLDGDGSFGGNPKRFRLGIEALRLGLAYEYDPYFALSIARVDPLPHQLEAVYEYFLKLPRIRFLLADDPGAGKTIMAGLLIKELKSRGLVQRILIVTPASLSFQWQRELKDKFRENFKVIRGGDLRANYGSNPWQEEKQAITSISWVSVIEDARESLLRSNWDLVIVDEAHKMSAYSRDRTTLAYDLGKHLSDMTDHFLLMTATPHKGDPDNFCLFLELLDKDVYGDVKSLQEAMNRHNAPFYLRRVKEALVTFPDPETQTVKTLFTKRNVSTSSFEISYDEVLLYDALTQFVEDQSIKATHDQSPSRGRALSFTMAMLQRRFASSVYAVRRSLERMKEKREKILRDPAAHRADQIQRKLPEDFEDLEEFDRQRIMDELEGAVVSVRPEDLHEEITQLNHLINIAKDLEAKGIETKLQKLRNLMMDKGFFTDPKMKLLIFTEHKDTLDFLVGKLREWGLIVTQIHGGMKVGDRTTPGTRIFAEKEFRESAQVLVATEAAGEGINLQFCWFLINYDIPWNPVRLEQRMGRIHRYGQEKDCLIFNFVSTNTREGRVLHKLFERIEAIERDLDPEKTGKIFNVLGDVFPSNELEKMIRNMYAHNQMTEDLIKQRIIQNVDLTRFKSITESTLEGLAKRELNLSAIIGKSTEAREKKLVPEVIRDFFLQAAPEVGLVPKQSGVDIDIFKVGKLPRSLSTVGERLEPRFGKLDKEYGLVAFAKDSLQKDPTLEWVTPGHPLFETVREELLEKSQPELRQGAVFYDVHRSQPSRIDIFKAAIKDGRGRILHQRLFALESLTNGTIDLRQPTIFHEVVPADENVSIPSMPNLLNLECVRSFLTGETLLKFQQEIAKERGREVETILKHVEISFNELIRKQQLKMADLYAQQHANPESQQLKNQIKAVEDKIDELNRRLEQRQAELGSEVHCVISDIQHCGSAWILPHPDRAQPAIANMVRDDEIELLAVEFVKKHEEAKGWCVESREKDNCGFDLVSRKYGPEDPATPVDVRFIEVKGRSTFGDIALSDNEYRTAVRLKNDYWLYAVMNCRTNPELQILRDPAQHQWKPVVKIEHYFLAAATIREAKKEVS